MIFDFRWLNVWNGCCVGPGQAVCTFLSSHVRLNLKVLLVFNNEVRGRNLVSMYYMLSKYAAVGLYFTVLLMFDAIIALSSCVVQTHYDGNDDFALISAASLLNIWNGCRVDHEQTARTFVLPRVCAQM